MSSVADRLPGGPVSKRPLHLIWLLDCSGSMSGEKIGSLNTAIKETLPHLRNVAKENPNANVLVRAIAFGSIARWHVEQPIGLEEFTWTDLTTQADTPMGAALRLAATALRIPPMESRALPPVLFLVSDGQPTDDFDGGLAELDGTDWGRKAVRISLAIGHDADHAVLGRFSSTGAVFQADNPKALVEQIRFQSTAALRAASQPRLSTGQGPGGGGAAVPAASPPVGTTDPSGPDVW
jgi:uncharacterized protein YegL